MSPKQDAAREGKYGHILESAGLQVQHGYRPRRTSGSWAFSRNRPPWRLRVCRTAAGIPQPQGSQPTKKSQIHRNSHEKAQAQGRDNNMPGCGPHRFHAQPSGFDVNQMMWFHSVDDFPNARLSRIGPIAMGRDLRALSTVLMAINGSLMDQLRAPARRAGKGNIRGGRDWYPARVIATTVLGAARRRQ